MIYNYVSSKEIVSRVYRNFRIQGSEWVQDVPEWIGDVYAEVGGSPPLEKLAEDLVVASHRTAMPCGIESIRAVEYEGQRLVYGGDVTLSAIPVLGDRTTNIYSRANTSNGVIAGTSLSVENYTPPTGGFGGVSNRRNRPFYQVNPGYIETSFEEGTIRLHYERVPTDENGYPKIPDNTFFKNACADYILYMLISGGKVHPVLDYNMALSRWIDSRDKAQVKCNFPDFDRAVSLQRAFTRLGPIHFQYEDFQAGSENTELLDI